MDIYNIAYIISNRGAALFQNYLILEKLKDLCSNKLVFFTEECEGEKLWGDQTLDKITITKNWKKEREEICDYINDVCTDRKIDLIILSSGKLLCGKLLDNFKYKILNTHPALLPSFKGYNVQSKSWKFNFRFMGITTHFIDAEVDEGNLLCQGCMPFNYDKTYEENLEEWFKLWKIVQMNTIYLIITNKLTIVENNATFSDVVFNTSIVTPKSNSIFMSNYISNLIN